MSRPVRPGAAHSIPVFPDFRLLLLAFALPCACAQGVSIPLSFAEGRIACEIVSAEGPIPELVLDVLPIAMNAALETMGPPPQPAPLVIRLQPPPSFAQRAKSLFRVEVLATQQGDEISLRPGGDPLKLAFRLGHELSHWLVHQHHAARPPLWLDEGLANGIAAAAAEACARTRKLTVKRPLPPRLDGHLFPLAELTALDAYPRDPADVGAFYWQSEALVAALREKLGGAEFQTYLGLLSAPGAPAWDAPLRDRWYFTDWDIDWLERQIRPESRKAPPP